MPIADTHPTTIPPTHRRTRLPIALAYTLALLLPALADPPPSPQLPPLMHHRHPPHDAELHEHFYSTWMRPAQPDTSCCNKQDCAPVSKIRRIGDRWEALREKDGAWLIIPPHTVEQRRDSPDGRSHLCSKGTTVFCFVAGAGI